MDERTIVYLGPSLPIAEARMILPEAIFLPPARQGDIVSHLAAYSPNRIILIDGEFRQNLSPWHKEIVFALQYTGVEGVYGAASMGALRASECHFIGMVGIGKIFGWYRDGVTEDDSEVALHYAVRVTSNGPVYHPLTVPLANIRAGVEYYQRHFPGEEVSLKAERFLLQTGEVYYMERTPELCELLWEDACGVSFPHIDQKRIDALNALTFFKSCEPEPMVKPRPDHLTSLFHALFERERRIPIGGRQLALQHIDSYVMLHNPEYERICWDSANQELVLVLCNLWRVTVGLEEAQREAERYKLRAGIETDEAFAKHLKTTGWSQNEFDRLMIANARIHKLQRALAVTKNYRRNVQAILDYLRTHQGFEYWANLAAQVEHRIVERGTEDWLTINLQKTAAAMLAEHMETEGLELKSSMEEYLIETGFSNNTELSVALQRLVAAKED